jgi:hypothetical protein
MEFPLLLFALAATFRLSSFEPSILVIVTRNLSNFAHLSLIMLKQKMIWQAARLSKGMLINGLCSVALKRLDPPYID